MSKPTAQSREFVSPAAERMRRHRERKRQRLRLLHVLLRESEIDALIVSGLLQQQSRNDQSAVTEASSSAAVISSRRWMTLRERRLDGDGS
jgi:hypothetical protein